ncbi:hypothetical protein ACN5OL_003977 [Cronobacter sakazakii]|uniref:HORMA-1 domain-containing protein n=1 Tax=Cronobacter sakazakii TaxID=28141 RepID=UPI000CFA9C47|nr:hypothetical protein [Cronobacter sakazakii]ELQ6018623.1 hypothetical protein [Cronobacter sakazakii]ELY4872935.1 hypothetical protein [Cronobacter sakazakii]ELY6264898.1 hypothetical protein [Cronobacter sakazakii]EMA4770429.1 hypothetical protein [Cronobacter sakazakii]MDK1162498.1 hypothetical protein [Cronobacter sakazakii]
MSSYSYTVAETQTFSVTHARHMAAKVATDLRRMSRFYGYPSDADIESYEAELVVFLKAGYLGEVTYGFKKNNNWIEPTLRYTAGDLLSSGIDDDPGKIRPGKDVSGATFYSFMTYSSKYINATQSEKDNALKELPFKRVSAQTPGIDGYLENDKTYSAGGRALTRTSVRNFI